MDCSVEELREARVEVSGWDTAENFFVEKSSLDWGREGKCEVLLHTPLCEGCVVFVRLLRAFGGSVEFPVAYRVAKIEESSADVARVVLERLHPRAPFKETLGWVDLSTVNAA